MALSAGDILTYDGSKWVNQPDVQGPFGIGTTPVYQLHAVSGATGFFFTQQTGTALFGAYNGSGKQWSFRVDSSTGRLDIRDDNAGGLTERITVTTPAGNVGIGTTSPSSLLHVVGVQPASVSGSGTAATQAVQVTGGKGGNTTGTTGQTGGAGAAVNITGGAGGDAPASSTNADGGSVTLQGGAAGSGAGAAGAAGNVIVGPNTALLTTAKGGFLCIPTTAGQPTGGPTNPTGKVPLLYDTSNNKLWVYNGTWKGVVLA
jgi:hypothetical protein